MMLTILVSISRSVPGNVTQFQGVMSYNESSVVFCYGLPVLSGDVLGNSTKMSMSFYQNS